MEKIKAWFRNLPNRIRASVKRNYIALIVIASLLYFVVTFGLVCWAIKVFEISDVTGIGQLIADICLFPTVLFGFLLAIYEYRKAQALPDIKCYLFFDAGTRFKDGMPILHARDDDDTKYHINVNVTNVGNTLTNWYSISISMPSVIRMRCQSIRKTDGQTEEGLTVKWHMGNESNHTSESKLEETSYIFNSNGVYALYPGQPINLATITLKFPKQTIYAPIETKISYSVVTDKTETKVEEQKLILRQEDFSIPPQ